MTERRSEQRLQDVDLVMISWEERGTTFKQLGNVEDLSYSGLGIVVDHPLPVDTVVSLSYGDGQFEGVVRHQFALAGSYLLGIEFSEASKNSPIHFQPELLVKL